MQTLKETVVSLPSACLVTVVRDDDDDDDDHFLLTTTKDKDCTTEWSVTAGDEEKSPLTGLFSSLPFTSVLLSLQPSQDSSLLLPLLPFLSHFV